MDALTLEQQSESISWKNPRLDGRILELDGIRGLAILLVLLYHYIFGAGLHAPNRSWQAYSLAALDFGWTGVDLFFVLSGFLIGGILYDAKDSPHYYRTFYCRRISRIFPLYFIWIALFVIGVQVVGPDSSFALRRIFNREVPLWQLPLFLQNVSLALHQKWTSAWIDVTWSLAVEEQFYLLLPLLVRNLSYRGTVTLAMASIIGAPVVRLVLWYSGNVYMGPYVLLPSRADALGFGVLVALACRKREVWEWLVAHRKYFGVAFLLLGSAIAVVFKQKTHLFTLGLTGIAALYALLLLIALVTPGPLTTRLLRNPALIQLGTVAYAVYLFHQGVNAILHFVFFDKKPGLGSYAALSVTALSLSTVFVLAAVSWKLLEKPLIRRAHALYRY